MIRRVKNIALLGPLLLLYAESGLGYLATLYETYKIHPEVISLMGEHVDSITGFLNIIVHKGQPYFLGWIYVSVFFAGIQQVLSGRHRTTGIISLAIIGYRLYQYDLQYGLFDKIMGFVNQLGIA